MSFRVIKGTFHVVGYSPDGDSIRFKADNKANWKLLNGKVKLNKKAHAQLRIEAIDTLETHYKNEKQPDQFANLATENLFKLLKIKNVKWNKSRVKSAIDGTKGYIVSRTAERFGRPVAFVFSEEHGFEDGQELYLTNKIARKSINYKILSKGYAYPTFYDGMFYDLRELFAKRTKSVRKSKKGIYSKDKTNNYFEVRNLQDVTKNNVIMPKLFRRITTYIKQNNLTFDAYDFIQKLEENPEKILILPILHFTHLDNIILVDSKYEIKLKYKPEDIVFLS